VTELTSHCDENRKGWNPEISRELGASLCKGLTAFSVGDYETTIELMKPIRYDLVRQAFRTVE